MRIHARGVTEEDGETPRISQRYCTYAHMARLYKRCAALPLVGNVQGGAGLILTGEPEANISLQGSSKTSCLK